MASEAEIKAGAAAIANARGGRRGAPAVENILDVLRGSARLAHLYDEVMEDSEAALKAAERVRPAAAVEPLVSDGSAPNPFTIGIAKNEVMGCCDLVLQLGGIKDEETAKTFAKIMAEWLTEESGWFQRAQ
jgi:hypothetical protein